MTNIRSSISTWSIRILLVFVGIICLVLLMLSMIAGTSESHRKGLEQAFSDSMNADVKLGKLNKFNVIPQLTVDVSDMEGVYRGSQSQFMVDNLVISFAFYDLVSGRHRIEDFQLKNFRLSKDSKYDLQIEKAGINQSKEAAFTGLGTFEKKKFDFSLSLAHAGNGRQAYYFAAENKLVGHYGDLDIEANIVPIKGKETDTIKDIKISSKGKNIATGHGGKDASGAFKIQIACEKSLNSTNATEFKNLAKIPVVSIDRTCL